METIHRCLQSQSRTGSFDGRENGWADCSRVPGSPGPGDAMEGPDYVIAYYAAIRSGNIALPVVPLLPAVALKYMLEMSGAGIAFLSAEICDRLSGTSAGLAKQPQVVVF